MRSEYFRISKVSSEYTCIVIEYTVKSISYINEEAALETFKEHVKKN